MDKLKILVVEDENPAQAVMAAQLTGHTVDFAKDKKTAQKKLSGGSYDLCFLDLMLGLDDNYSGLKLIADAKSKGFYSVVMTSSDSDDIINKAYELGCDDFYIKGNEKANISAVIAKYLQRGKSGDLNKVFSEEFITEDPATRANVTEALKYAASGPPILILGPTGTGKTCLAQIIHKYSGRSGEFVAMNCSAYTEELMEAELFGYRKGAFTGANETRKGRLFQANNGTLFLDEIGSMSLNMQAKLLKAIEEKSFYPLGADKQEHSDFRIISATLEALKALITQGRLRLDFFQRIHGLTVNLKPLRERACDISPLIRQFTRGTRQLSLAPDAKTFMLQYEWPGNIRELKKLVDLLVSGTETRVTLEMAQKHLSQELKPLPPGGFLTDAQYKYAVENGLDGASELFTYEIIRRNMQENNGNKSKVMANLKISTNLLYARLKKFEPTKGDEPDGIKSCGKKTAS